MCSLPRKTNVTGFKVRLRKTHRASLLREAGVGGEVLRFPQRGWRAGSRLQEGVDGGCPVSAGGSSMPRSSPGTEQDDLGSRVSTSPGKSASSLPMRALDACSYGLHSRSRDGSA